MSLRGKKAVLGQRLMCIWFQGVKMLANMDWGTQTETEEVNQSYLSINKRRKTQANYKTMIQVAIFVPV